MAIKIPRAAKRLFIGGAIATATSAAALAAAIADEQRQLKQTAYQPPPMHDVDGFYGMEYNEPGTSVSVLYWLGDSIAAGTGASHARSTNAAITARRIATEQETPILLINTAEVGAIAHQLRGQQIHATLKHEGFIRHYPMLKISGKPSAMVVSIGGNDALTKGLEFENSRSFYANVRDYCPGTPIVAATCPDARYAPLLRKRPATREFVSGRGHEWATRQLAQMKLLNEVDAEHNQARCFYPISIRHTYGETFQNAELFYRDGFHLNDEGQEILANGFVSPLLKALRGEQPEFPPHPVWQRSLTRQVAAGLQTLGSPPSRGVAKALELGTVALGSVARLLETKRPNRPRLRNGHPAASP